MFKDNYIPLMLWGKVSLSHIIRSNNNWYNPATLLKTQTITRLADSKILKLFSIFNLSIENGRQGFDTSSRFNLVDRDWLLVVRQKTKNQQLKTETGAFAPHKSCQNNKNDYSDL